MPEYRITWHGWKTVPISDEVIARVVDEAEAYDLGWDMYEGDGGILDGTGVVEVEYVHE